MEKPCRLNQPFERLGIFLDKALFDQGTKGFFSEILFDILEFFTGTLLGTPTWEEANEKGDEKRQGYPKVIYGHHGKSSSNDHRCRSGLSPVRRLSCHTAYGSE